MTSDVTELVVFLIDSQPYAIWIGAVERIVRAVEVTLLPNVPASVVGVINVEGRVIPVLSLRRRFGLPQREVSASDQFIIGQTTRREVALIVDSANGVIQVPNEQIFNASKAVSGIDHIQGVARTDDGMVLIHDLERFLSYEEEAALEQALRRGRSPEPKAGVDHGA